MMNRFLRSLVLLLVAVPFSLSAQTRLSGKVYDAETREGVPFVTVALKNTTSGTTTDIEGNYNLLYQVKADSVIFSYVGYKRVAFKLTPGVNQKIDVALEKQVFAIGEVIIKAGENPAHRILRKVWEHKPDNDKERLDAFQYEVYNKLEFDVTNISEKLQDRKLLGPVKFVFDFIDSSNTHEKPHLPLFFSESVSDFYYTKDPKFKKEVIKGSKVSGMEDASIAKFTGEMYQNVNIYENNLLVFGKYFVSPVSESGILFYKYYLIDSLVIGDDRCYQIQFEPKRKQELTFTGNMWIADTAFAVKRIEMSIAKDANINYVNTFYVIEEFDDQSGNWMMTKEKVVAEFNLQKKQTGLYGRKTTSYKNIVVNTPKERDFYSKTDNIIVQQGAEKRDDAFWAESRHDTLTKKEQGVYKMVDTVMGLKFYKSWESIAILLYSGYKVLGPWELGPYFNMVSFNQVEGLRFRVGGRTSNSFSRKIELGGYAAYGLKDEEFKFAGHFKVAITKKPWQIAGFNYKNDYEILGQSSNAFTSDNILSSLFRRNPLNNMTRVEQYQWWYDRDLFEGFNLKVYLLQRNMHPLFGTGFNFVNPDGSSTYQPGISTAEARFKLRFAYGEKYVENVFSRVSVGTKSPIVQLMYTAGVKGVFGSQYQYHKFTLNVNDRFRINPIGFTDWVVEAGKIYGTIPYPLMELHGGNETWVYDPYAFNRMNYYEFASDQYATVQIFHHFDGFFLNKIPLMRKLKWRETLTAKALVGTVSDASKNYLPFPSTLHSLNRGPYYEVGCGLENIFKFFRVDAFWRLSYLDPNLNANVSRFGILASMQVIF